MLQSFDELLLLKRGGRVVYFGNLGERSVDLVDYLQVLPLACTAASCTRSECCLPFLPIMLCSYLQIASSLVKSFPDMVDANSQKLYSPELNSCSQKYTESSVLVQCQAIEGVPHIEEGINPATYALQVISRPRVLIQQSMPDTKTSLPPAGRYVRVRASHVLQVWATGAPVRTYDVESQTQACPTASAEPADM